MAFPFLIQLQALLSVQQISFLKDLEILLIFNSLLNYLHLKVFHLLLSFEEQVPRWAPSWHAKVLSSEHIGEIITDGSQAIPILEAESPGN